MHRPPDMDMDVGRHGKDKTEGADRYHPISRAYSMQRLSMSL